MQHFSQDSQASSPSAVVIFDCLTFFSFFLIIKMYIKFGPVKIFHCKAKKHGLMVVRVLIFFGVVLNDLEQIGDFGGVDTQYAKYFESQYLLFNICYAQLKNIEGIIAQFFPRLSKSSQDILAVGVHDSWRIGLYSFVWLRFFSEQIAKELDIPCDRIAVVSQFKNLVESFRLAPSFSFPSCPVQVIQQPFGSGVIRLLGRCVYWNLRSIFCTLPFFSSDLKIKNQSSKVAAAAIWGINMGRKISSVMSDFSWWKSSGIPGERLVYCYEREDFQPTEEKVNLTDSLGIQSFVLDHRFSGNYPKLVLDKIVKKPFWLSLKEGLHFLKRSLQALFLSTFPRSVVLHCNYHLIRAIQLTFYYKALNVKGIIHFQTGSFDWNSLAMELAGGCRFGIVWSSISHIGPTCRAPQVFFAWGANDGNLFLDCESLANHVLIAGTLVDKPPQKIVREKFLMIADQLRAKGARFILVLFGTSYITPNFFYFFLNWLVEDPNLGLLIKDKGMKNQSEFEKLYNLNGLSKKAFKTGRVQVLDSGASPADVAVAGDFAIGICTYSAVQLAAINGARVIFVDFERIDQGPYNQPCFLLHSLGPNRCVFYDFDSVKKSILEYVHNPESNPDLGDASPVLHLLDPFQDGQANQRIGEYIGWYMDGIDRGLSRDDALNNATKKYAIKWGEDKVLRGLLNSK